jgi:hypothetical protein
MQSNQVQVVDYAPPYRILLFYLSVIEPQFSSWLEFSCIFKGQISKNV